MLDFSLNVAKMDVGFEEVNVDDAYYEDDFKQVMVQSFQAAHTGFDIDLLADLASNLAQYCDAPMCPIPTPDEIIESRPPLIDVVVDPCKPMKAMPPPPE